MRMEKNYWIKKANKKLTVEVYYTCYLSIHVELKKKKKSVKLMQQLYPGHVVKLVINLLVLLILYLF